MYILPDNAWKKLQTGRRGTRGAPIPGPGALFISISVFYKAFALEHIGLYWRTEGTDEGTNLTKQRLREMWRLTEEGWDGHGFQHQVYSYQRVRFMKNAMGLYWGNRWYEAFSLTAPQYLNVRTDTSIGLRDVRIPIIGGTINHN